MTCKHFWLIDSPPDPPWGECKLCHARRLFSNVSESKYGAGDCLQPDDEASYIGRRVSLWHSARFVKPKKQGACAGSLRAPPAR